MQSLRTRRPSQADGRKQQRSAQGQGPGTGARPAQRSVSRTRDARKSKVDDRIKKRMSMRYADISGPTDAMGVPAVPSLPIGMGAGAILRTASPDEMDDRGNNEMRERRRMDAKEREMRMLDEKGFDPDVCEYD